MERCVTRFFLPILMLTLAPPATAAQPAAPATPRAPAAEADPEALAAARALLQATDFDRLFRESARLTAIASFGTMIAAMEEQHGRDFPPDLEQELRQILDEHVQQTVEVALRTALEDSARIYARYFSAAEIRELQRLQTNPVMIRYQQIAPQFMAEMTQIGIAADAARMPQLMARINEAVTAWARRQAEEGEPPAA